MEACKIGDDGKNQNLLKLSPLSINISDKIKLISVCIDQHPIKCTPWANPSVRGAGGGASWWNLLLVRIKGNTQ